MNADDILDIIGDSKDKYVRAAHDTRGNRHGRSLVNFAIAAAACIIVVPIVLFGSFMLFFGGMGASAPAESGGGGINDMENVEYMSYEGPVLPLAALDSTEGIEASRKLDISFAPLSDEDHYSPAVALTDSYVLTNTSSEDITFNAVYPYVSSYWDGLEYDHAPMLYINGTVRSVTEAEIVYGQYTGSFVPVYGAEEDPEMSSANLSGPNSFNDYVNLLSNGNYLKASFSELTEHNIPVTVYRLSDYEYTTDEKATNPTLNIAFEMDKERTSVFTWNFNGGRNNTEEGKYERHVGGIEIRPNASPENIYPRDAYLIVLGDDIENWSVQGYRNGGCDTGDELDDLACTVSRYESTLEKMLLELMSGEMPEDAEALYPIVLRELYSYSPVGAEPVTRYSNGMLDSFVYDVKTQNRIAYLSFSLTVPAGGEVSVELRSTKRASYNYHGSGGDTSLYGFEFATRLGSSLAFTEQRASLSDYDSIMIVSSNFGFDIESGETEVLLDPNTDCYWLNIREKRVDK